MNGYLILPSAPLVVVISNKHFYDTIGRFGENRISRLVLKRLEPAELALASELPNLIIYPSYVKRESNQTTTHRDSDRIKFISCSCLYILLYT